jgi:hypothetical protein
MVGPTFRGRGTHCLAGGVPRGVPVGGWTTASYCPAISTGRQPPRGGRAVLRWRATRWHACRQPACARRAVGEGARRGSLCPRCPRRSCRPLSASRLRTPRGAAPTSTSWGSVQRAKASHHGCDKVAQLESTVAHLRTRWADQHPGSGGIVSDITQVVGAAALLFSAGDTPRRMALDAADALVTRTLRTFPNLGRLASAGRLFVMMLESSQCPNTCFQRAVATDLKRLDRLDSIPEARNRCAGRRNRCAGRRNRCAGRRFRFAPACREAPAEA